MAATLRDVATLAGVSVKTVSNVVNGYSFVRPDNRRRVEEALAATGYRPHLAARNLRRGRSGFVALMLPELSIPYFGELAGLIIDAAAGHDWRVLIQQTQGSRDGERAALEALGPHMVDGAIFSPEALSAEDVQLATPGVPLILLGEHSVDVPADHVAIDNVEAARQATAHLLALGCRRVAAIGANPQRGTAAQRLAGYRAALAAAGVEADEALVAPVTAYHRREGEEAMAGLLALPDPPDGVFCFNDLLAVGAIKAAAERGVRVPEDLAVVGFDDTEEGAFCRPALTTVAPDKARLASAAVDLVARRLEGADLPAENVVVPFSLVTRGSTARSPQS